MQKHELTHFNKNEAPFSCIFCGKGFKLEKCLEENVLQKIGERVHLCEICGEGFTTSAVLKIHKLRHQPKKYKCGKCNVMCRQISALNVHTRKMHFKGQFLKLLSVNSRDAV